MLCRHHLQAKGLPAKVKKCSPPEHWRRSGGISPKGLRCRPGGSQIHGTIQRLREGPLILLPALVQRLQIRKYPGPRGRFWGSLQTIATLDCIGVFLYVKALPPPVSFLPQSFVFGSLHNSVSFSALQHTHANMPIKFSQQTIPPILQIFLSPSINLISGHINLLHQRWSCGFGRWREWVEGWGRPTLLMEGFFVRCGLGRFLRV
jgi:hypothetical protein